MKTPRKTIAAEIGYPVMIKAAEGGGGRGMRVVRKSRELIPAFQTARAEAEQAFGSPQCLHGKAYRAAAPHRVSSAGRSITAT